MNLKLPNSYMPITSIYYQFFFSGYFKEIEGTHRYRTRSVSNQNYHLIKCNTSIGQRSIRYLGAKCWNNVPVAFRNVRKAQFKCLYKNLRFAKY